MVRPTYNWSTFPYQASEMDHHFNASPFQYRANEVIQKAAQAPSRVDMSFVQVRAQLPTEELLEAVNQLDQTELDDFVHRVIALRAKRQASSLPKAESELLQRVNQGVPVGIQKRYDNLIAKRQKEILTQQEYDELIRLTQQVEKLEAERMHDLAELACLRQVSLDELFVQLGIETPPYA